MLLFVGDAAFSRILSVLINPVERKEIGSEGQPLLNLGLRRWHCHLQPVPFFGRLRGRLLVPVRTSAAVCRFHRINIRQPLNVCLPCR